MSVPVYQVEPHSPAAKKGIAPGDRIRSINGHPVTDVLDVDFYLAEERVELEVERPDGRIRTVKIRKEQYGEIGVSFETYLIDQQRSCRNNCIFCFVDQMPPGMRESLYFKDDDDRLSFLFGNYVTLTNVDETEIDRIIRMHISPINVSVHTTNPQLRCQMMKNRFAERSLQYLDKLAAAGISLNCQLVLCPGINDGEELARTLRDLSALFPAVQSIACVPVGLTRYREGLPVIAPYTADTAGAVIDQVEKFQREFLETHGERLAYPADEFYLKAGRPLPPAESYGEFSQLENGVGMLALFEQEFFHALEEMPAPTAPALCTIATGMDAAPFLEKLVDAAQKRWHTKLGSVAAIPNDFFGRSITVAGLVTGRDLIARLRELRASGQELGTRLLLPATMLRHEQDRFLDDITREEAEQALGLPLCLIEVDGGAFARALCGLE